MPIGKRRIECIKRAFWLKKFWLKIAFGQCYETAQNYLKEVLIWCKVTSQQLVMRSQESGKRSRLEA